MKRDLNDRTMSFALRIAQMVRAMPRGIVEDVTAKQVVRCATSIGANYCEACHARSERDFAAKLKICEGEAVETLFWLRFIVKDGMMPEQRMQDILRESEELVAIFTAATKKAYANIK